MAWAVFELRAREEESVGVTAYRRVGVPAQTCWVRADTSTAFHRPRWAKKSPICFAYTAGSVRVIWPVVSGPEGTTRNWPFRTCGLARSMKPSSIGFSASSAKLIERTAA
jgi:hypothetical protein